MIKLYIKDGNSGKSFDYPLKKDSVMIGKREGNDIILDRTNISREHCQIIQVNGGFFVRDLQSRNGTFVNGEKINGDTILEHGTTIQLGDFLVRFLDTNSALPQAPPAALQPPQQETAIVKKEETAPQKVEPTPEPAEDPAPPVDEAAERRELIIAIKRKIHEQLLKELNLKQMDLTKESPEELRERTGPIINKLVEKVKGHLPKGVDAVQFSKDILDEAVGLGVLEDLIAEEEIDEIMVNNYDTIFVERKGKLTRVDDKYFTDNRQLISIIRRILAPISRRVDESSPMVDARLVDGSRVNAIIPPLAISGPTLTIRKFSTDPFTVDDLIGFGSVSRNMADFMALCVDQRKNILVSGGTGSGKTTLLNVLSNFIPATERIITVEDAAELKLIQPHVVSLESKPANIEGKGAIPIRDLVKNSLRMRPDRIVVGECRGGEALDMLQAMNTGHDGSLTTLHANTTRDAVNRLETLVLMAGMELPSRAIREQIASAINVIIQQARLSDGTRKIITISEILGIDVDTVLLRDLFEFKQMGYDDTGRIKGEYVATGNVPDFIEDMQARGLEVDMDIFKEGTAA
ncbi:MAG: ATPase, T2SS/T4P/T4SS family [Planctomycetota bacterium]|jgi:pilus assembly protein CpaF|nr:ATPase, T2SS/T4P/T4SS family [Planctomycetota bacterium]MDP7133079.1 ATPase, T2SS/T4P/T4SS family [Planctomycetota bacterium]